MLAGYYLSGGAGLFKKYKMGAAIANRGVPVMGGAGTSVGVIIATTTSAANAYGLALDASTYTTTPTSSTEGIITVDVRPDLVIRALISGSATEGVTQTVLTNTASSSTVFTSASIDSDDQDGGLLYILTGANKGQSRSITAFSASTSVTATVAFPAAIAVGDTGLVLPWNFAGTGADGADGPGWVTATTLITQANAATASGAGLETSVVDMELNGATDSYILFVLRDHVHGANALAS